MANDAMRSPIKQWQLTPVDFDEGIGPRASIGIVGLAPDRAGIWDLERFLAPADGVAVFASRVPMAEKVSPGALSDMRDHLSNAAEMLVPGSPLGAIGFSCTSGTVAIGPAEVARIFGEVRPRTPVCTPVEAAAKAMRLFGIRRIGFLAPYPPETCDLVAGFLEDEGFQLTSHITFGLERDRDMNCLSFKAFSDGAKAAMAMPSEALFISCTALKTASIITPLELELGRPVFTSNQVLAWDCLRSAGVSDQWQGMGALFAQQ